MDTDTKTRRITIEVDEEVHAALTAQAKADDRPLVKYIRRILEKATGRKNG